jgi:hypothetical protein
MPTETERRWAEQWREAGAALDAVRRRELRELTPERALAAMDALLSMGATTPLPAARVAFSGLVEQQALFLRLRRP